MCGCLQPDEKVTILDVGTGNGTMLVGLAAQVNISMRDSYRTCDSPSHRLVCTLAFATFAGQPSDPIPVIRAATNSPCYHRHVTASSRPWRPESGHHHHDGWIHSGRTTTDSVRLDTSRGRLGTTLLQRYHAESHITHDSAVGGRASRDWRGTTTARRLCGLRGAFWMAINCTTWSCTCPPLRGGLARSMHPPVNQLLHANRLVGERFDLRGRQQRTWHRWQI